MHVEFLGIPRERAGVSEVEIEAETFGQLLDALAVRFPALRDLLTDGRLHSSIAANLNTDEFVNDPRRSLNADDRLILLSSDAGG